MKRILLLFLFIAFSSQIFAQCDTIKERAALLSIYNALDGANWYSNTNWNSNKPLNEWYNIKTDENGCVTTIILDNNNLTGKIPSTIGDFQQLKKLNLVGNSIHSTIPKEIENLNNLDYLNLSHNSLSGEIPSKIGNLNQLQELYLNDNSLSGNIPFEIGNLSALIKLDLSHNTLSEDLPSELSSLNNVTTLNVAYNNLSGCFPDSYETLLCHGLISNFNPKLPYSGSTYKICNGAPQIGAPCDDGDDRTKNDVIEDDCSCAGLEEPLNCSFQRDILKGFYRLTDGDNWINNENWKSDRPLNEWFGVEASSLDGCPTAIRLPANNLKGTISFDIGRLKKLRYLDLSDNHLNGNIPNEIAFLPRLVELNLSKNDLTGSIPDNLGKKSTNLTNIKTLKHLNLSQNQLSGNIPPQLANLNLESIYLDNNNLSECFADTIINKFCTLGFNSNDGSFGYNFTFNNSLPYTGDFAQVCIGSPQIGAPCGTAGETIDEDCACKTSPCIERDRKLLVDLYNAVNGSSWTNDTLWGSNQYLGDWFGITTNTDGCVTEINLPNNNLKGVFPMEIYKFSELKQLNLYKNEISGSIPKELENLKHLEVLRLFQNDISGSIPSELGEMEQLQILNISQNSISGVIPESFGHLSNLKSLLLFKNELTGNIPTTLGSLKHLNDLSLEHNKLSGIIPSELGNLKKLTKLDFSYNQLSGTIPMELGSMEMISDLRLNNNKLTSTIPSELGNLSHLYWLHLFENNLYGCIPNDLIQKQCAENKKFQFNNNPLLPHQGDLSKLCNDVTQIGAPCDDGDPSTPNDKIDENCLCNGKTVATYDILNPIKIKIYPNPASDVLHFEIENKNWLGNTNIAFYNLLGEEVRKLVISDASNFLDYRIDIPSGVYFCRVGDQVFKVVFF